MANQFRFFVGKSKEILNTEKYPIVDGQMFKDQDSGELYEDVNGERKLLSFQGDWGENDEKSSGYIKNRTHYQNGDELVKLDVKFLPDSVLTEDEVVTDWGISDGNKPISNNVVHNVVGTIQTLLTRI